MNQNRWIAIAALLAAVGVGLGAFGAHGLKDRLVDAGQLENWHTAVRYQHNDRTQRAYMKAHDYDMRDAVSCMLAIMPEDHWVSLDADSKEGHFVYEGTELHRVSR